ncbi:hypothetical protein GW17_00001893 [Ensete ventricosum]|nr:hypothetical protein GW17_00001893 [Ensete ventricosum]
MKKKIPIGVKNLLGEDPDGLDVLKDLLLHILPSPVLWMLHPRNLLHIQRRNWSFRAAGRGRGALTGGRSGRGREGLVGRYEARGEAPGQGRRGRAQDSGAQRGAPQEKESGGGGSHEAVSEIAVAVAGSTRGKPIANTVIAGRVWMYAFGPPVSETSLNYCGCR